MNVIKTQNAEKFTINVTNHCIKYFKKIKIYRKKAL